MGSFRALLVLVSLLLCFALVCSRTLVTHLPGFTGPLPFYLETGYEIVDEVNGGELFYYFIKSESESDASKDPVLLWLSGGLRCSSFGALAFEIGPLKFVKEKYNGSLPQLEYYPYSWTKYANIIFLDSPLGAGFSYSWNPEGYQVGDKMAAVQINKFLHKWFVSHPQYLSNPFLVAGDSYAGKIVPYASELITQSMEAGQQPLLNFKGYLAGNPSTGDNIDENAKIPYAHGHGFISDKLYQLAQTHCIGQEYSNPSTIICAEVIDAIEDLLSEIQLPHILEPICILSSPNPRNQIPSKRFLIQKPLRSVPPEPPLYCRSYSYYLAYFWANDEATRKALGVKQEPPKEWMRCHYDNELPYEYDLESSIKYHFNVTSKGYRALVYSGDHDLVVPFLGTQTWIGWLNFSVIDAWRAWHVDGHTAGFTEAFSNNLTFATVKGAGHTAPEYQPKECLAMFRRWISNQPL